MVAYRAQKPNPEKEPHRLWVFLHCRFSKLSQHKTMCDWRWFFLFSLSLLRVCLCTYMAWAQTVPSIPSSCCACRIFYSDSRDYRCKENHCVSVGSIPSESISSWTTISRVSVGLGPSNAGLVTARRRLSAVETHIAQSSTTRSTVEIPVTCYQVRFFFSPWLLIFLFVLPAVRISMYIYRNMIICEFDCSWVFVSFFFLWSNFCYIYFFISIKKEEKSYY